MIAALFVESGGVYYGLQGVDPWDATRDARRYAGPHPVVAHPPCSAWCQLASVNEARWGTPIGEDDGCFAAALEAVRTFGGVLEHPAYSLAWIRHGLPVPLRGGWTQTFNDPGMTTEVSQVAYGHLARKRTWLYAVGTAALEMDWREPAATAVVGAGIHTGRNNSQRLKATLGTPPAFRDVLLELAGTVE